MHPEVEAVVRQLYRLFLTYERIEVLAASDQLPASEQAELVPALGELSFACWRGIFGAAIDTPTHRRFVLNWCLRNAELLMKEEILPVIAHQVVASQIGRELSSLPETEVGYDFSQEGPGGGAFTALRRVYLIQSLANLLEKLAGVGQIPAKLQTHLRRHLVSRVKSLFAQSVAEPDKLSAENLPPLQLVLESFCQQGKITADLAQRLLRVGGSAPGAASGVHQRPAPASGSGVHARPAPASGSGVHARPPAAESGRSGSRIPMLGSSSPGIPRDVLTASVAGLQRPDASRPLTPSTAAPQELIELAAAGELMRRLRRQTSLAVEDRDRLVKRIETEMEDLLDSLGARRLDRALSELGERLGIPVPPRAAPAGASGSVAIPGGSSPSIPRPAPDPANSPAARLLPAPKAPAAKSGQPAKTPDSSDYQWAFDLIEDLRRENVEPEGSSGK